MNHGMVYLLREGPHLAQQLLRLAGQACPRRAHAVTPSRSRPQGHRAEFTAQSSSRRSQLRPAVVTLVTAMPVTVPLVAVMSV